MLRMMQAARIPAVSIIIGHHPAVGWGAHLDPNPGQLPSLTSAASGRGCLRTPARRHCLCIARPVLCCQTCTAWSQLAL